ncbi:MAG: choice-of-anchor tandem repeat GloVer-containing protein [Verrucomicrobiota bacterium]
MRLNSQTQRAACVPRRAAFLPLLQAAFVCGLLTASAHETNYQVIKFLDGMGPTALIEGKDGNLYGTLHTAGEKAEGVVFKLKQDGSGYTVLHHFTGCRGGGDGSNPHGLVEGSDGALYGTTKYGGVPGRAPVGAFEDPGISDLGNGTVFKVNKNGSGYSLLRRFTCRNGDGSMPYAGVVEGRDGGLYGTTFDGGIASAANGIHVGTVFGLNKDGSRYQVLYTFGTNTAPGARPWASLVAGSEGTLYGTEMSTVFKLNPEGRGYRVVFKLSSLSPPALSPASK